MPSPAPAAFLSLAGTTAIQQLTTEVPVVSSSPIGNPSAVDQVTQVVQSVRSSLAGGSPSTGALQPKDMARVPLKLKTKIWNNEFIDFGLLLANNLLKENISSPLILAMALHPLWLLSPLLSLRKLCQ